MAQLFKNRLLSLQQLRQMIKNIYFRLLGSSKGFVGCHFRISQSKYLKSSLSSTYNGSDSKLFNRLQYNISRQGNQQNLLKKYEKIKSKQQAETSRLPKLSQQQQADQVANQNTKLSQTSVDRLPLIKCQGCNVRLQYKEKQKYGYINQKVFKQSLQENKNQIEKKYGVKVKDRDAKILDLMHQVQKQSGIQIFDSKTSQLQNMNNVEVLMRLQQKIDKYEQSQQLLNRSKHTRRQLLCFRCYSLKHHNRLPEQYDNNLDFTSSASDFILNKMFNRHKSTKSTTQYLYLVDALDILGTFQSWLFKRMISEGVQLSLVVNKIDVLNKQYVSQNALRDAVKKKLKQYLSQIYGNKPQLQQKLQQIKIFFISCNSREGVKKLTEHLERNTNSIQVVGYPNTGKTTLLNIVARIKKSTSKVPGTTIKISQHQYRNTKRRVYDMPGLFSQNLLYNLITKPSIKSMLTWHKRIAPGLLTNHAFIYGGKIQIPDTRIIIFGHGGACQSTNRWFIDNRKQFWKGLPDPEHLKIKKYQFDIEFTDGRTKDLQIAGYGFIGLRLCIPDIKSTKRKLTLYLPQKVEFGFRDSVLSINDSIFHNKSAISKRFMLQRLILKKNEKKQKRPSKESKEESQKSEVEAQDQLSAQVSNDNIEDSEKIQKQAQKEQQEQK